MMGVLKVLYVGATWKGSSARSMREGLAAIHGLELEEIGEDLYLPRHQSKLLRAARKLLEPAYRAELRHEIERKCALFRPDVLIVYKGNAIDPDVIGWARSQGIFTVNIFPDVSPHAFGGRLKDAIGRYDLVISTKPYHPQGWSSTYGYDNRCLFVPHGYDPAVHLWDEPPTEQDLDIVMAATWRLQYEDVLLELADELADIPLKISLAGAGWAERRNRLPGNWVFPGPIFGRAYGEFLRRAKIVIAPVHRDMMIEGARQPGDEDTTRTYELAAAGCFFLHRRTPYAAQLYDENTEVPMWDDAAELAGHIRRYLPDEATRRVMALRAHCRAVPDYSVPARARQVMSHIRSFIRPVETA